MFVGLYQITLCYVISLWITCFDTTLHKMIMILQHHILVYLQYDILWYETKLNCILLFWIISCYITLCCNMCVHDSYTYLYVHTYIYIYINIYYTYIYMFIYAHVWPIYIYIFVVVPNRCCPSKMLADLRLRFGLRSWNATATAPTTWTANRTCSPRSSERCAKCCSHWMTDQWRVLSFFWYSEFLRLEWKVKQSSG